MELEYKEEIYYLVTLDRLEKKEKKAKVLQHFSALRRCRLCHS